MDKDGQKNQDVKLPPLLQPVLPGQEMSMPGKPNNNNSVLHHPYVWHTAI